MSFSSSHAFLLLIVFVVTSRGICQPKWLSKENAQRKPASMSLRDSAAPRNAVLLYLKGVEKGMLKGDRPVLKFMP